MDRIDVSGMEAANRRGRYFSRAAGTEFRALAPADGVTEIDLYDEIGMWGVTAKDFKEKLRAASGDVVLKINSPGGDVFDGIAIYNELVMHKGKVRVEVMGMAASAASIVAMAGNEIAMAANAFMMIHNAWVITMGDRHALSETAAVLGKIDEALARTYAAKSGSGIRSIRDMMDAETWMTGKEAIDQGFATEILQPVEAQAKFDVSSFRNAPQGITLDLAEPETTETERDIEKVLMRDAGYSRSQARALIKDIRAGKTSSTEAMPGAGETGLFTMLAVARVVNAALPTRI